MSIMEDWRKSAKGQARIKRARQFLLEMDLVSAILRSNITTIPGVNQLAFRVRSAASAKYIMC